MRSYSEAQRAEALRLYSVCGATEAANRTGIPRNTIWGWANRGCIPTHRPDIGATLRDRALEQRIAKAMLLLDKADVLLTVWKRHPGFGTPWIVMLGCLVDQAMAVAEGRTLRGKAPGLARAGELLADKIETMAWRLVEDEIAPTEEELAEVIDLFKQGQKLLARKAA